MDSSGTGGTPALPGRMRRYYELRYFSRKFLVVGKQIATWQTSWH
jgi:hypothetical protein